MSERTNCNHPDPWEAINEDDSVECLGCTVEKQRREIERLWRGFITLAINVVQTCSIPCICPDCGGATNSDSLGDEGCSSCGWNTWSHAKRLVAEYIGEKRVEGGD